jgi:hypothetical protein
MRKILLSVIMLISFTVSETFAQSATAVGDVYMSVNDEISLTKIRDLNMGYVVQGVTSVNINPLTSNASAYFTFAASPNSFAAVFYSSTNLESGSNTIAFTGNLVGNDNTAQNLSTLVRSGATITTNASGNYYLWAGGTASLAPDQPIGTYSGSFTISVTY